MRPIIRGFLKGFNGTVFAYGQTSSGKTFTMQAGLPPAARSNHAFCQTHSLMPRFLTSSLALWSCGASSPLHARARFVRVPFAFRSHSDRIPVAFRSNSGRVPVTFRDHARCVPGAFRSHSG